MSGWLFVVQCERTVRAPTGPFSLDTVRAMSISLAIGAISDLRYQGPEQRSRERADMSGRIQHGYGTNSESLGR